MAPFDCKPEGISARWEKWVRRLEESVFAAEKITDPLQKKGQLLNNGGDALHDIWDVIKDEETQPGQEYEELICKFTKHFKEIETSVLTGKIMNGKWSTQFKDPIDLGSGGNGTVYKVKHKFDQQLYAVKEVKFRECNEKAVERVLQEVIHLAKLSDRYPPHIVRYYSAWVESEHNPPPDSSTSGSQRSSDRFKPMKGMDFYLSPNEECPKCKSGNMCKPFLLYIQMELCDRTLADWLKERNNKLQGNDDVYSVVNVAENERIMEQLQQGLAFIHAMEIIHRDVKPENIFMTRESRESGNRYRVKFGDFGLTKDTSVPNPGLTHTLVCSDMNLIAPSNFTGKHETDQADTKPVYTKGIGTTYYAAPEQLDTESKENYDHKADMYSLGVVLYELYQPFTSETERGCRLENLPKQKEKFVAILKRKLPNVASLILELLSKRPADRPSASDLVVRTEEQRMLHDREVNDQVKSLSAVIQRLEVKDPNDELKSKMRALEDSVARRPLD